jgi:hypothetical protein
MPNTPPPIKLKEINQGIFIHTAGVDKTPEGGGVCYYMCNFIEGPLGPWSKPDTFDNAIQTAKDFCKGSKMYNFAVAQATRKAGQQSYTSVTGALVQNRVYRAELWVEDTKKPTSRHLPNHEILVITGGTATDIIYFDPNSGFFQAYQPAVTNREALENCVRSQYANQNLTVDTFRYRNLRSLTESSPTG